jgi:hypothetical protein
MKRALVLFVMLVGFAFTTNVLSQAVGDFQSYQAGDWNNVNTWSRWSGTAWTNPAPYTPDSTVGQVTILSPHTITVNANVGVDQAIVNSGATVIVNCKLATLTIATGGMTVNGILTITDTVLATTAPYNVVSVGTLTIGTTGTVNINEAAASSTKGFLPTATWQDGSTLNINGIGGTGATGWGAGGNQSFYNVNVNYTVGTANFGWGFTTGAIRGELKLLQTGTTGRFQLFGGSQGNVTINKITQTNGMFTGSGTGTAGTRDTVFVTGDVSITGGVFAVDRGSHGTFKDSSGVKWYFYGNNIDISPNSVVNGVANANGMANSNVQTGIVPYALDSRFIMAKAGAQNLKIVPALCTSTWGITVELINGSQTTLTAPSNIIYLILTSGNIIAPTASPLTMGWNNAGSVYTGTIAGFDSVANANATNNIVGKLGWLVGSVSSTTKVYPIAKGGKYRPITFSFTPSTTTISTFYAEMFNSAPAANILPGTLNKVSSVRYYTISEGAGGSTFTNGIVTLNYETDDGVTDFNNLRVVKDDGAGNWMNLGGVGTTNGIGSILSTVSFTLLSNFTLANATGGGNPLQTPKVLNLTALIEGFYDGSTMVPDTVTVELRNTISPFGLIESKKIVLNNSGQSTANFYSATDGTNYYIALKHRNSLQTWSANTPQFSSGTLTYNFTTSQAQAYGNNMKNVGGEWCIYNGDVNADEFIDGSDVSDCFNDANIGASGYVITDLTGDDFVDGTDVSIAFNNSNIGAGAFYPSK